MEIKMGEYVRTKYGVIAQVIDVTDTLYWFDKFISKEGLIPAGYLNKNSKQIENHSKNIIDLLQEGDIVNKQRVYYEKQLKKLVLESGNDYDGFETFEDLEKYDNGIETILTKEQYERNCYTVERK